MPNGKTKQIAKISSLESAKAFFIIVAGLAIKESLEFLLQADFNFTVRFISTLAFLFTVFRFSHGIAVVYEFEKKAAEASTTPSAKKVEQIFALFVLEGVFLFLMSKSLSKPLSFALWTTSLLLVDLIYIIVSKTLKDANTGRIIAPWYWVRRWGLTQPGTAPRTHLQWAISDIALAILFLLTLVDRPRFFYRFSTGNFSEDWVLALAAMLIVFGVCDYVFNYAFYFGPARRKRKRCVFLSTGFNFPTPPSLGQSVEVRQTQKYCRELLKGGKKIPFAPQAFYPYFLDTSDPMEHKLSEMCALQYLPYCEEIYFYSNNQKDFCERMQEERRLAIQYGLEIKVKPLSLPGESKSHWDPLHYPDAPVRPIDLSQVDVEQVWKKVFVCSPLHPTPVAKDVPQKLAIMRSNIRVAQWICHELITSERNEKKMIAPFAPQIFYPYFTTFLETDELTWLDAATDTIEICDAMYVYVKSGQASDESITRGMRE
jgi:hypothetical protein